MRWELSEEQADFQSVLRDWLRRHSPTAAVREWADDPAPFERRFHAEGWAAVGSPEELGGQGGDLVESALVAEELGRAVAPSAAWLGSVLAGPGPAGAPDGGTTVLAVPSDAPPDAPVPVVAVPVVAVPVVAAPVAAGPGAGDRVTLTGTAAAVLGADRARRLLVPFRCGAGVDGADIDLALVEAGAPGVEVRPRALTDRTRSVADVVLSGAVGTVPSSARDTAGAVLRDAALRAAVLVSADALGAAARMLEMTVEYAKQRHQFGVPIGSFQAVKHAAAQMLVQVESARSIVYLAAASVAAGHLDAPLHAAAAKAQVTAGAADVADAALTVHGAIGYTWEHDLQLYYKRAKLDRVLFGAPSVWNERIATALDLAGVGQSLVTVRR